MGRVSLRFCLAGQRCVLQRAFFLATGIRCKIPKNLGFVAEFGIRCRIWESLLSCEDDSLLSYENDSLLAIVAGTKRVTLECATVDSKTRYAPYPRQGMRVHIINQPPVDYNKNQPSISSSNQHSISLSKTRYAPLNDKVCCALASSHRADVTTVTPW